MFLNGSKRFDVAAASDNAAEIVPLVPVSPVMTTTTTTTSVNHSPSHLLLTEGLQHHVTSMEPYGAIPAAVVIVDENNLVVAAALSGDEDVDDDNGGVHDVTHLADVVVEGPVCRDGFFALFFLLHLGVVAYFGIYYAPRGLDKMQAINMTFVAEQIQESDDVSSEDYQTMVTLWTEAQAYIAVYPQRILTFSVLPACLMAFIISFFTINIGMKSFPEFVVASSLFGPLLWVLAVLAVALWSNVIGWFSVAVPTIFMLMLVIYFIVASWRMLPYAAVNLAVALEGISSNWGTYLLAFVLAELNCVWFFAWLYVTVGLLTWQEQQCPTTSTSSSSTATTTTTTQEGAGNGNPPVGEQNVIDVDMDGCDRLQGWTLFLLLLSLYWTSTVIANTLQVTVAGVMATWCFDKRDARGCCSPAVYSSLFRSLSFSFGSICFGSLVQALVSLVRGLLNYAKSQRDDHNRNSSSSGGTGGSHYGGGIFLCLLECLAVLLDEIVQYINQWAFVFVGIYGYSYWQSGKRVMEVFRQRGWTSLITNSLINYVLGFTTLTVGLCNGFASIVMEAYITNHYDEGSVVVTKQGPDESDLTSVSYIFGPLPGWRYWAFGIGFVMGVSVCSVMMNVIQGAVNTLIVCWADAPSKLEENHPVATQAMAAAWAKVFPESVMYFSSPPCQVVLTTSRTTV